MAGQQEERTQTPQPHLARVARGVGGAEANLQKLHRGCSQPAEALESHQSKGQRHPAWHRRDGGRARERDGERTEQVPQERTLNVMPGDGVHVSDEHACKSNHGRCELERGREGAAHWPNGEGRGRTLNEKRRAESDADVEDHDGVYECVDGAQCCRVGGGHGLLEGEDQREGDEAEAQREKLQRVPQQLRACMWMERRVPQALLGCNLHLLGLD